MSSNIPNINKGKDSKISVSLKEHITGPPKIYCLYEVSVTKCKKCKKWNIREEVEDQYQYISTVIWMKNCNNL